MVTGGQVVNPDAGMVLREVGLEVLGSARRVVVSKDDTVIVDGGGTAEAVANRAKTCVPRSTRAIRIGIGKSLASGWPNWPAGCCHQGGAATETALKERKESVEDAVAAAKAAVEEGIVPGGEPRSSTRPARR